MNWYGLSSSGCTCSQMPSAVNTGQQQLRLSVTGRVLEKWDRDSHGQNGCHHGSAMWSRLCNSQVSRCMGGNANLMITLPRVLGCQSGTAFVGATFYYTIPLLPHTTMSKSRAMQQNKCWVLGQKHCMHVWLSTPCLGTQTIVWAQVAQRPNVEQDHEPFHAKLALQPEMVLTCWQARGVRNIGVLLLELSQEVLLCLMACPDYAWSCCWSVSHILVVCSSLQTLSDLGCSVTWVNGHRGHKVTSVAAYMQPLRIYTKCVISWLFCVHLCPVAIWLWVCRPCTDYSHSCMLSALAELWSPV